MTCFLQAQGHSHTTENMGLKYQHSKQHCAKFGHLRLSSFSESYAVTKASAVAMRSVDGSKQTSAKHLVLLLKSNEKAVSQIHSFISVGFNSRSVYGSV